jgi:hypothetical protein
VTILGPDISSYQAGLDLSRLANAAFVIAKTTEGTYYTDADFEGWRRQAASLGKPFIWYHFLSGENAHAQAAHTANAVPDHGDLPGMLDAEPTGSFSPTLAQMIAYVDAAHDAGLNLRLIYLPRWYWQQIGSPGLTALADRGLALVSSAYPGGTGNPLKIYPGDGAVGWQTYGGMTPALYQFTNQATDGGMPLDYNAYRGDLAGLNALLKGTTVPMALTIPDTISKQFPEIADQFPPGAPYTDDNALIWSDARAAAAALYAKQARDEIHALAAKLGTPPPPPTASVDVDALTAALVTPLSAALAPHITGGVDVDQIAQAVAEPVAHAVLMHMAGDLQAG